MIRFSNPRLVKMANGKECIELTKSGNWESFPAFADKLVAQIGAKIIYKGNSVDMHIWELEYSGAMLNLVYDDYPNGVSIEPKSGNTIQAINDLFELFSSQSAESGL